MNEELIHVEKTDKKGYGIFAKRKINRGELIISEKPLIVIDRSKSNISNQIDEKLKKLSIEDKNLFFSLYDCYLPSCPTSLGIFETNCFTLTSGSNYSAVYSTVSRLNHSCLPNVYHSWNDEKKCETVYALRDIDANEELLTSYIDLYLDKQSRLNQLKKLYRFECECELCTKSLNDVKKSDIRRKVIGQLDEDIAKLAWSEPEKAVVKAEQILKYLKDEGMFYMANYIGRVGYDVFQILFITSKIYNSNKNNSDNDIILKNWAKLTIDNYMICSGTYDCILKNQLDYYANL